MALFALQNDLVFPPVHLAEPDGLLAIGGDLSSARLILAYQSGIFPWYEGNVPLWWSPDPRFVLYPGKLKISKSMQQVIKKKVFSFRMNSDFKTMIRACKIIPRKNQPGTWITDEVEQAYCQLHEQGYAHSAEAWLGDELVGGLYGIQMGRMFFGESMFSSVSNASKFAFILHVQYLQQNGVELIDCQVYSEHLERLGAEMIPRTLFIKKLKKCLS